MRTISSEISDAPNPQFHEGANLEDFVPKHAAQDFGMGGSGYQPKASHTVVGHVCFKRQFAEFILQCGRPRLLLVSLLSYLP